MILTLNNPKSKRSFEINILKVGINLRRSIITFIYDIPVFFATLISYILGRGRLITLLSLWSLYFVTTILPSKIKHYVNIKLIWSRGRLGRSMANFLILIISLALFIFGEVFNRTGFVAAKDTEVDYLSYQPDIIPNLNTAATTIPDERKRAEAILYEIAPGDTLSSIGSRFKISIDALEYVNNFTDNSVLTVGKTITIPPISGLIHTVERGDTLASIATKYQVASQATADFNYLLDTKNIKVGTELVIPGAKVPERVIPAPSIIIPDTNFAAATPSKNYCVWPSTVRIITQYFSWYHNGLDIATPTGRPMPPLFACTEGTVTRSGWDPWGLGLHVRITHSNGYETVYGHMSRIDVSYGQEVSRGQVIGIMGSTGNSTGPHVHYMIKYNGVAQNPLNYMN